MVARSDLDALPSVTPLRATGEIDARFLCVALGARRRISTLRSEISAPFGGTLAPGARKLHREIIDHYKKGEPGDRAQFNN